jgi:thiol-disulfide isomerase/thioredoxin
MKVWIAGALLGLVSPAILCAADEKPVPAAPTEASAEALVEQIEELLNSDSEAPNDEARIGPFWAKQLTKADALIGDFRARFAVHPLRWRVLMLEATSREIRDELNLPMPKGSRPALEIYAEIIASPQAEPAMKAEASAARLLALADQVTAKKQPLAAWEKQFAAHMKSFPEHGENLMLVEMRLLLIEEHDKARLLPTLEELSKSPVSEIAELAASKLTAVKAMAELKSKPLELKFKAVDGSEVDLEKLRGKVVLVDFWATWCGPCMAELPTIVDAYEKFKAKGFEIIGISLDEEEADLTRVLKAKKITWPQYFDGKGWESPYAKKYGIEGIPTMWLVNKAGMVVDVTAQEDLASKVEKWLAE